MKVVRGGVLLVHFRSREIKGRRVFAGVVRDDAMLKDVAGKKC